MIALVIAALPAGAEPAASRPIQSLAIAVGNNQSPGATLYLAVYSADDLREVRPGDSDYRGWSRDAHLTLKMTLPDAEVMQVPVELPQGLYALRAYVDENANGELDTVGLGRPVEAFAISVGMGRDRPSPKFHQSVVSVDSQTQILPLMLIYPAQAQAGSP